MRSDADWQRIERDYRAGEFSISEIARQNVVGKNAIAAHAARMGWVRARPEPMSEERRRTILAKLGSPSDVQHKLGEFVKGIGLGDA